MKDIKYKVNGFDDLIGMNALKKSLNNLNLKLPILFEGEKGCGKTTLANIIAARFGACKENIQTINCSFYNKKDDMRMEIKDLYKSSIYGTKKVLILDEIHSLRSDSQEPWLIPLQSYDGWDNPNTLVIGCTTSVENLLDTFLRRFLRFKVTKLNKSESVELIKRICKVNNIELSTPSMKLIVGESDGIPGIIYYNIPKLIGISDINEIKSILARSDLEGNEDLVTFIKIIMLGDWNNIKTYLSKNLIRKRNINEIRVGLMNLIAAKCVSNYYNSNESNRLQKLYQNLYYFSGYPEKSNLIMALHKTIMGG